MWNVHFVIFLIWTKIGLVSTRINGTYVQDVANTSVILRLLLAIQLLKFKKYSTTQAVSQNRPRSL